MLAQIEWSEAVITFVVTGVVVLGFIVLLRKGGGT